MIETLDDIIEQIANWAGVYGAHDERCGKGHGACRCCWTAELKGRILWAVEVERKLYGQESPHA